MKTTKLLNEVILLRVFAILSVVVGHSIIIYSNEWNWYTAQQQSLLLHDLKSIINIYQMPLFISLSGYLFYFLKIEKGKYDNFGTFIFGKIKRLIVPFVFIGLIAMIPLRLLGEYSGYDGKPFIQIVFYDLLLGGDPGNLWFLPVLFINFIVFYYYAKYIYKDNTINKLTSFVVFALISVISTRVPDMFFVRDSLYYLLFFYIGFATFSFRDRLYSNRKLIIPTSFILQFGLHAYNLISLPSTIIFKLIGIGLGIFSSIMSCIFFYSAFIVISQKNPTSHDNVVINFIDKNSFGLYLFHSSLLYPVLNYGSRLDINPILFSVITFVIITTLSLIITYAISQAKQLKFIVGQ